MPKFNHSKQIVFTLAILFFILQQQPTFGQQDSLSKISSSTKKNKSKRMSIIKLSPLKKDVVVQKGAQLTYTCKEHVSAGYTADFSIGNKRVITAIETTSNKPDNTEKPQPKGADKKEITFVFEATAKGQCELVIRQYFRNALEKEYKFQITVE